MYVASVPVETFTTEGTILSGSKFIYLPPPPHYRHDHLDNKLKKHSRELVLGRPQILVQLQANVNMQDVCTGYCQNAVKSPAF